MTVDPRSILKRKHALRIHMVNETKNTQIIETDIATDAIVLGIDRNNQAKITSTKYSFLHTFRCQPQYMLRKQQTIWGC